MDQAGHNERGALRPPSVLILRRFQERDGDAYRQQPDEQQDDDHCACRLCRLARSRKTMLNTLPTGTGV